MLGLSAKQVLNIYIIWICLVYKNHRLFLAKYNHRFHCETTKIRKFDN